MGTDNGSVDLALMEDVFRELEGGREALIPALQRTQEIYGWVPREAMVQMASRLSIAVGDVYETASFYTLLETSPPTGEGVHVCRDAACLLAGGEAVWQAGREALGDRLKPISCLGHCHAGPVALTGGSVIGPLKPESWQQDKRDSAPAVPILSPPEARRLLARIGRVAPDSLSAARAHGAYQALERALRERTPGEVIEEVTASGLQGRGGAGFPTGRKWAFAAQAAGKPKYIICNADESEPGTFKDRALMEGDPHRVLEGIILAGYAVGAEHGIIYIRGEYRLAYERLEQAIRQAREANLLGEHILGSDFHFDIELHSGSGAYICGEETALIESLEGKPGRPRQRPPYPPTFGLWGKPTVVNNVETLANVPDIVLQGAEAFRDNETKLYCLTGHVARPGLIEAPLGLTLRRAIEEYGGGMAGGGTFHFAQTGGAAGTLVGPEALDVPLTFTSLQTDGVALGSGALLVVDESVRPVDVLHAVMAFFARESCGHCYPCRYGTLRAAEVLSRAAAGRLLAEDETQLHATAEALAAASFCGLGQAAAMPLRTGLALMRQFSRLT
ncbi:MAG: NADP oxidoreductase [Caldilineae bacterium]|nr:MAG: NADP oxidoreductase [Caldilineae bacterium]